MTNKINKLHGVLIEDAELTERVKKLEDESVSGEKLDMLVDQINDYINETDETIEKINDDFQTLTNTAITLNNKIKIIDEGVAETVNDFKTTYDLTTLYTGTSGQKYYRETVDLNTVSAYLRFPSFIIYGGNKYMSLYLENYYDGPNDSGVEYSSDDFHNILCFSNGLKLHSHRCFANGWTTADGLPTEQKDDAGNVTGEYVYYKVTEPSA